MYLANLATRIIKCSLAHDALEEASHASGDKDGAHACGAANTCSGSVFNVRATSHGDLVIALSMHQLRTSAAKYLPNTIDNEPHVLIVRDGDQKPSR